MKPAPDELSLQTKAFVGVTSLLGAVTLAYAFLHWQSTDLARFGCYLAIAVLASGLKVQLPGIDGTMSVNFLFILLGVMELSPRLWPLAALRAWYRAFGRRVSGSIPSRWFLMSQA